jgi:hypothetical protein
VSDQAFYIPAIQTRLDPALFPRDRPLLEAEGRLMVFDDGIAWLTRSTGWTLEVILLGAFAIGLAALAGAVAFAGGALYRSPWTTAALLFALTLRHRIPRTGVNTLEGYLHPRMVAFAAGVFAIAVLLRARPWAALAFVAAAAVVHPTTAVWFAILLIVAIAVDVPHLQRAMLALMAVGALAALLLLAGPLRERLVVMDPAWVATLTSKDYLFPAGWPIADWIMNLAYPILIVLVFLRRRRARVDRAGERGLVIGGLVLFAMFLASVPLTMMRLALAVQLQVPRIFWILDLLATLYVVWIACEGTRQASPRRSMVVALIVLAASAGRGMYVMLGAHADRALIQATLPEGDWTDIMRQVAKLPPSTHVLADPGHAWKYGTSVRVAAGRDVYLEDVKDTAIAMYSREVAARVASRAAELRDFANLTADQARALAADRDLDVLVVDRDLPLPEVGRTGRFRVYRLR